ARDRRIPDGTRNYGRGGRSDLQELYEQHYNGQSDFDRRTRASRWIRRNDHTTRCWRRHTVQSDTVRSTFELRPSSFGRSSKPEARSPKLEARSSKPEARRSKLEKEIPCSGLNITHARFAGLCS